MIGSQWWDVPCQFHLVKKITRYVLMNINLISTEESHQPGLLVGPQMGAKLKVGVH